MFTWIASFVNLHLENAAVLERQAWQRRKRDNRVKHRPWLEKLHDRITPSCTDTTLEPWCLDDGFGDGTTGHGTYDINNHLEEAKATIIQPFENDDRFLIGGFARDGGNYKFALMRLRPNGKIDNGDDAHCGGTGFGRHLGGNDANGVIVALGLQQLPATPTPSGCGGAQQRIIAAGIAPVAQGIVGRTFGVARYCPDGELDTSWGGTTPEWAVGVTPPYIDPQGMVTIAFNDSSDDCEEGTPGWAKKAEAYAVAIEPTSNKIVVGGKVWFPPPPQPNETTYFAMAKLNADGSFDDFGSTADVDCDHGRIHFDGDGDTDADYTENEIRGLQLMPDSTTHDILIAGQTKNTSPTPPTLDVFVARVDSTGVGPFDDWSAPRYINWQDSSTSRNDIAMDLVYRPSVNELVVVGITCSTASCIATDTSPSSDIVLVKLNDSDGSSDYEYRITSDHSENSTYTDVANSVVLQPDADNPTEDPPAIVVGGYSVASDGGTPYMSGRRFAYSANPSTFDFFRSNFSSSAGVGDQALELQVQTDNRKIVAGGFHTTSNSRVFAAIRTCPDTSESNCTGNIPGPGGGGFQPPAADFSNTDSFATERTSHTANQPAQLTSEQSPVPPIPETPAGDGAMQRRSGASRVIGAKPDADALLTVANACDRP